MTLTPLTLIGLFVLGTLFSSFLSVLIYRLHHGKGGVFFGVSACPHCNKKLGPRELIPLFSYVIQGGKCRKCHKPISWHYPTLELSTGLIFVGFALAGLSPLGLYLVYGLVLAFIFFYDVLYLEVHDAVMIPSILLAAAALFHPETPELVDGLLGAGVLLAFFGGQILLSRGKWMGSGDLRIGAFMGLILGLNLTILATFSAYVMGSIVSLFLLGTGRVSRKTMVPFGPFLVLGTLIALLYGEPLIEWYLNFIQL